MTNKELEIAVLTLQKQMKDLQLSTGQRSEFSDTFSGKQIINHEVQFMQRVRDRAGNVIAN